MDFLADYGLFAAKLLTIALLLVAIPLAVTVAGGRRRPQARIEVEKLNDRQAAARRAVQAAILPRRQLRRLLRDERRARDGTPDGTRPRTFVCRFKGDLQASAVVALSEEINAILIAAAPGDRVVVVLESAGGTIHGYGLAASQLARVRARGLPLTVLVDRIAASGGYMMACVADRIVAAPFAIVGSIGVVAQLPNFHRLLQRHDVDFEQMTAGRYKRTLSLFGENTDEGRAKFQQDIDDAHALFKDFVSRYRPALDLERVATGEYWFGQRALELGLVDAIATSDGHLAECMITSEVYLVSARLPLGWRQRLRGALTAP